MKKIIFKALGAAALTFIAAACSHSNEWTVEGNIAGADGDLLTLEASNNGIWYQLDTVTLNEKGNFKFTSAAAGYPDIYRLRIGNESIYFPVDSIETVTVNASVPFGGEYSLSGSDDAVAFERVNMLVNQMVKAKGAEAAVKDPELKKALGQEILANPASMTAYYIINKKVGSAPLFDTSVSKDVRIIGAVANAFATRRPLDPRTSYLKDLYLKNRPRSGKAVASDTIVAYESNIIDIRLLDEKGNTRSLADAASKGDVVILNFTALSAEQSPAFNLELGKIYEANHDKGLEIYQVGVDPDEFAWRNSAKNLPWITVYANPSTDARVLVDYNVSSIPTIFIVNRQGELVERVDNISSLSSLLRKYL